MIITICDDNEIGRKLLRELLERYSEKRNLRDMEILEYESPVRLEQDLDRIESDVYLLDIFFPDGNGIELAQKIRLRYHHNPIVFITASGEHTMHAFKVFALRYFVKPVNVRELYETLDYALTSLQENSLSYFTFRTAEGTQQLRFSTIMYVERSGQTLLITTNTGKVYESVTLRESFGSKLQALLEDARFVQTHVSYVVNLDAVASYQKNEMLMQDGRSIPISRKYGVAVKEHYHRYFG